METQPVVSNIVDVVYVRMLGMRDLPEMGLRLAMPHEEVAPGWFSENLKLAPDDADKLARLLQIAAKAGRQARRFSLRDRTDKHGRVRRA